MYGGWILSSFWRGENTTSRKHDHTNKKIFCLVFVLTHWRDVDPNWHILHVNTAFGGCQHARLYVLLSCWRVQSIVGASVCHVVVFSSRQLDSTSCCRILCRRGEDKTTRHDKLCRTTPYSEGANYNKLSFLNCRVIWSSARHALSVWYERNALLYSYFLQNHTSANLQFGYCAISLFWWRAWYC